MPQLTEQQRIFLINETKNTSYAALMQLFVAKFPGTPPPTPKAIYNLKKKFTEYGVVTNRQKNGSGAPATGATFENTVAVLGSVADDPKLSTRKRAANLDIPRTTLRRILTTELKLFPYRWTVRHTLQPQDGPTRVRFADWFLPKDAADEDFIGNIWWTDEAKFCLHGSVNSHNARHWGSERPTDVQQRPPQSSPKLNVWCAISSHGIIGPYFFRDAAGATVTVNGDRYLEMLENYFIPELFNFCGQHALDPSIMSFMQDGARVHIPNRTLAYLGRQFGNRTIGEKLGQHWPARSPDLTPCDFFLWGWLKDQVYKRLPLADLAALEAAIRQILQNIPITHCQNSCFTVTKRMNVMKSRGGAHIEHLL